MSPRPLFEFKQVTISHKVVVISLRKGKMENAFLRRSLDETGQGVLSTRNDTCKDRRAGVCLACSRQGKNPGRGDCIREVARGQIMEANGVAAFWTGRGGDLGLCLSVLGSHWKVQSTGRTTIQRTTQPPQAELKAGTTGSRSWSHSHNPGETVVPLARSCSNESNEKSSSRCNLEDRQGELTGIAAAL